MLSRSCVYQYRTTCQGRRWSVKLDGLPKGCRSIHDCVSNRNRVIEPGVVGYFPLSRRLADSTRNQSAGPAHGPILAKKRGSLHAKNARRKRVPPIHILHRPSDWKRTGGPPVPLLFTSRELREYFFGIYIQVFDRLRDDGFLDLAFLGEGVEGRDDG